MDFYNRQRSLGLDTGKCVVVIGCGGIGMNAALQLAMAGIKKLIIFDADTIEPHNLNRLPVPANFIGRNKADTAKTFIELMRPDDVDVTAYPFNFNPDVIDLKEVDFILDCTDVFAAQNFNQKVADDFHIEYAKAGYDGFSISINNRVAQWDTGNTPDGYQVVPSYCVPAIVIASLAVHKILTNSDKEIACQVKDLYSR